MDFVQSNNEHCRHFLLNGAVSIDGHAQPETMMQILRSCSHISRFSSTLVSFGKDGSAIRGTLSETLNAQRPDEPSPTVLSYQNKNPVVTMTTHNFPSGVTPFPGAESLSTAGITRRTGVGGQIREVVSTGNGAKVMGGAAGFVVGNLNIPGLHQPWEGAESYPSGHVEGVSFRAVLETAHCAAGRFRGSGGLREQVRRADHRGDHAELRPDSSERDAERVHQAAGDEQRVRVLLRQHPRGREGGEQAGDRQGRLFSAIGTRRSAVRRSGWVSRAARCRPNSRKRSA